MPDLADERIALRTLRQKPARTGNRRKKKNMEELYVCALLCSVGFDRYAEFQTALERHFLADPANEALLDLEERGTKDAILHALHRMAENGVETEKFGKKLMAALKLLYRSSRISDFAGKMYALWRALPEKLAREEPFATLSYADDCLPYGDEAQCRRLYEAAFDHYARG